MNVLLAVDNSPHSQVAIDVVLSRVWPDGTTFKVFCAVERRQPIFAVMQREEADAFLSKALKAAEEFTKDIAEQLQNALRNCNAINVAAFGDSKEMILDQVEWADLIVVGSHGRHGVPRFFLGSVSQTVLLYSECSTLVARYQQPYPKRDKFDKNVLVALDDTEHSKKAFDWVMNLPWSPDARFNLVHILTTPEDAVTSTQEALSERTASPNLTEQKEHAMKLLEDYATTLEDKVGIGKVNIELRQGDAIDEILAVGASIPAGLIVMGSRMRGKTVRLFMGGISQEIVLNAPCPVEVVK